MTKTIEQITADTILQTPNEVNVDGEIYKVAPPTTATLIRVSALISQLPQQMPSTDNVLLEGLSLAQDCKVLGNILATLILGVKKECKKPIFRIFHSDKQQELADLILRTMSPKDLKDNLEKILISSGVGFFLSITTSLIEVNQLRKSRTQPTQTIPSGE